MKLLSLRIGISLACALTFTNACTRSTPPTAKLKVSGGPRTIETQSNPREPFPAMEPGETTRHFATRMNSFIARHTNDHVSAGPPPEYKVLGTSGDAATVSTLAGSDIQGYQDGPGSQALFENAYNVCVDDDYNVYVYDEGRLRKVSPTGDVSTIAGTGEVFYVDEGPTQDQIGYGELVAGKNGTVYQADEFNRLIRKIDTFGHITELAGSWTPGERPLLGFLCQNDGTLINNDGVGAAARFGLPRDIANTPNGLIYVADRDLGSIRRIDPADGAVTTILGPIGCLDSVYSSPINFPSHIFATSDGSIFTIDYGTYSDEISAGGSRLTQILPTFERKFGGLKENGPAAMDNNHNLYQFEGSALVRYSPSGEREIVVPSLDYHELRRATRTGGPASV